MSILCRHKWKELARTYVPPLPSPFDFTCSELMAERLLSGLTTIVLQCQKCQVTRREECLGKEVGYV